MTSADAVRGRPVRTGDPSGAGDGAGSRASPATRALRRFGRRYPALGRAAVSVPCALTAPFAAPPAGVGAVSVAAALVVVWNVAYLALVLPDGRGRPRLLTTYAVDLALLCALCLAQPLLVEPTRLVASLGWVSPMASFTVVGLQFLLRPRAAAAATLAVVVAFVGGAAASPGVTAVDGLLAGGAWMAVEAALARLLWWLLQRGGREADRVLEARFAAERAAATAAARRAAQRAHWATVHDTSATTLMMIGLGEVGGTEEWLPAQVRRDITLLGGDLPSGARLGGDRPDGRRDGAVDGGAVDVAAALRTVAVRARVRVSLDCPDGVLAPPTVCTALSGATAEALENVRRHAGTGAARLTLRRRSDVGGDAVEVTVTDAGPGFDPAAVGPHRFGLAWSVHDRMHAVGGTAVVESAPGRGTVVALRWPS